MKHVVKRRKPVARPYHHGDLRVAILEAAWAIVTEEGLDALTLRACARRANVSHAAPFHHFGTLAALLAELAADGYERLGAVMDEVASELPNEPLRAAGLGYIRFAAGYPEHFRVMSDVGATENDSVRLREAAESTKRRLEDALQATYLQVHGRVLDETELVALADVAWCSVHGYAILFGTASKKRGGPDPDRFLARLRPALLAPPPRVRRAATAN